MTCKIHDTVHLLKEAENQSIISLEILEELDYFKQIIKN